MKTRAGTKQCKNLTCSHDLVIHSYQQNKLLTKHGIKLFQHLFIANNICFGLSKISWTKKDLKTCIQIMSLGISSKMHMQTNWRLELASKPLEPSNGWKDTLPKEFL